MGFTADTAVSADSDLLKYAYEQQIANLQRGGNTFVELHKGATNDLIRRLRAQGFTTTQLSGATNVEDWKPALVAWVLSKIFAGQGGRTPAERDQAVGKAAFYADQYERLLKSTAVVLADATVRQKRGLPICVNVDGGTMFPSRGSSGPTRIAGDKVTGFDELIVEGE